MYSNKITYSPNKPLGSIKLCSDCKFYKPVLFRKLGTCELCGEVDMTNGEKKDLLATNARLMICGEEAKFFINNKNNYKIPHILLQSDIETIQYVLSPFFWSFMIFFSIMLLRKRIE